MSNRVQDNQKGEKVAQDSQEGAGMGDPDIIDRIDALVDEQLANYENRSGYDHDVNQEQCGHCWRDWHGLAAGQCPGSMFIGPLPPVEHRGGLVYTAPIGTPLPTNVDFDLLPWTNFGVIDSGFPLVRGERVGWDNGDGIVHVGTVEAHEPDGHGGWTITIGNDTSPAPDARTPQQRALPRPSTTPPMWSVNPGRQRRRS